ncbi:MarR family winged helix-turn-helix transcriptional regulator [Actinomadura hibisca]|uniref:MarR family winged helix-turn-helix transcriptional regulator n=1 Tax=Actinomadura hibisca TaxID=68565 RepID=UPI00082AEFCC|nr:MarR family transcriptional regulator [Actinomadura hibisca]
MTQSTQQAEQRFDPRTLEEAGRAFVSTWCRSQQEVAGHVPPSQLHALETISARPDISVRDLAAELHAIPSSASRLCDRLVAAGLLERLPNDADRRLVALRLTVAGEELMRDVARQRRRDLAAVLDRLSAEQRARLVDGLTAFADHVGQARH